MRTLKLAAIAAGAILAAAAGGQVRGGVYDYSYTPTYSGYPVSGSVCPTGQCGSSVPVPSYSSYAPSYSYTTYAPSATYGGGAAAPTGSCPNGCCGVNGGCCANGRCGTCPAGTCRSGNCPANCPNGQCNSSRNRDAGPVTDAPMAPSYAQPEYSRSAPRYTPTNWSPAPSARRNYDAGRSDRVNGELESPFYN
jgi:hypothetical protein